MTTTANVLDLPTKFTANVDDDFVLTLTDTQVAEIVRIVSRYQPGQSYAATYSADIAEYVGSVLTNAFEDVTVEAGVYGDGVAKMQATMSTDFGEITMSFDEDETVLWVDTEAETLLPDADPTALWVAYARDLTSALSSVFGRWWNTAQGLRG